MPTLYALGTGQAKEGSRRAIAKGGKPAAKRKDFKDYVASVVLMIPSELVGPYLIAKPLAENSPVITPGVLGFICWLLVIPARLWASKSQPGDSKWTRPKNLGISLIAFPIWVWAMQGSILNWKLDLATASIFVLLLATVGGWFYTNPNQAS